MAVLHFVTDSVPPHPGGLQESVMRIACGFAAQGFKSFIHTLAQPPQYPISQAHQDGVCVADLRERSEALLEPFRAAAGTQPLPDGEETRVRVLGLREQISQHQARNPGGRHIIVSFFAMGAGFCAQHVAMNLGLPHVASVRGTDYSRGVFGAASHSKVRFVVENAAQIVTTNHEQSEGLSAMFRPRRPIRTIYNALEDAGRRPFWEPLPLGKIRLISDCGFSGKKATHLLLSAVATLIEKGLPVSLTVLGGVFSRDSSAYWEEICRSYQERFPESFSFPGHQPVNHIDAHLLDSHVYCSASLSEGCSLSHLRALTIGIPMVATACGVLPQMASGCDHVWLCAPGDRVQLADRLETAAKQILAGRVIPDRAIIERWRACFSPAREREQWRAVIDSIAE